MTIVPPKEVEIDEALVRALLQEQHPDLAHLSLTELAAGWDNWLWRLGDGLLVRLPTRALAAPLTLNEQRWLPELAGHLPLPVPAPVRVGVPSADYPWPWSVVPWLEGQPGDKAEVTRPEDAAHRLGSFLRALHQPAPSDAPRNPYRGVPLRERAGTFEARLSCLAADADRGAARRVWDGALAAAPWAGPPTWLHGDLHPANTVVRDGTLAAVIDFGDMGAGDPATDLAAPWMLLPTTALPAFGDGYGAVDADLEARTLGWAVLFAVMLIAIGLDVPPSGRPSYEVVGRRTLARVVAHGL